VATVPWELQWKVITRVWNEIAMCRYRHPMFVKVGEIYYSKSVLKALEVLVKRFLELCEIRQWTIFGVSLVCFTPSDESIYHVDVLSTCCCAGGWWPRVFVFFWKAKVQIVVAIIITVSFPTLSNLMIDLTTDMTLLVKFCRHNLKRLRPHYVCTLKHWRT
jgi:hypothetical protein